MLEKIVKEQLYPSELSHYHRGIRVVKTIYGAMQLLKFNGSIRGDYLLVAKFMESNELKQIISAQNMELVMERLDCLYPPYQQYTDLIQITFVSRAGFRQIFIEVAQALLNYKSQHHPKFLQGMLAYDKP